MQRRQQRIILHQHGVDTIGPHVVTGAEMSQYCHGRPLALAGRPAQLRFRQPGRTGDDTPGRFFKEEEMLLDLGWCDFW
jgi:hypothetical protein